MAISANLERLNNGNPTGCIAPGLHRQIIQGEGATRQLLPEESGALCLFDRAAGIVYTLPTPIEGMQFDFLCTVSVTSNSGKVITKTVASEFMIGGITMGSLALAEASDSFTANGTTIVSIAQDGGVTGGILGGFFRLTALSTTLWGIEGVTIGAGTLATPFATS